jgi:hypothetical protein
MKWYGIKAVFRRDTMPDPPREKPLSAVEERVVILTAADFDEAVSKGEEEAREYAASVRWPNDAGQEVVCRYLGAVEVFALSDEPASGTEVFSKIFFVPRDEVDARLVDRLLGAEGEDGGGVSGSFEPDFEKIVRSRASEEKR